MTQTDTQTHRQTDTQTDTLGSIATYSVKLTEYKNRRRRRPAPRSGDPRREKKQQADALKAKSNVGLLHPKLENTQTSITSGDTRVAGAFSRNFCFLFFRSCAASQASHNCAGRHCAAQGTAARRGTPAGLGFRRLCLLFLKGFFQKGGVRLKHLFIQGLVTFGSMKRQTRFR